MPAFNKSDNQAVVSTGLTSGFSRNPGNQSMGTLFEGVGAALQNGLNAYDESTKVKIEMAADEAVNGPNGAVAMATPDAEGNFPAGAQAGLDSIAGLKAALDQGTISQVTFDTNVAKHAKRIRGSVPAGYGPIVEQKLSAAVGSSTANQQRQTELAAIDEARAASDKSYKENQKWITDNLDILSDDSVKQYYSALTGGGNVEDMILNPDPANIPKLKLAVSKRKALNSNVEAVKLQIENQDRIREDQANTLADEFIGNAFNSEINKDFGAFIAAKNAAESDGVWTPQEEKDVGQTFMKFYSKTQLDTSEWLAGTKVKENVRTELTGRVNKRLDAWKLYLDDPKMGALGMASRLWAGQQQEYVKALVGSNDTAAFLVGAQEAGIPPDVVSSFLNSSDKEKLKKDSSAPAVLAILTGKKTVPEAVALAAEYGLDNPNATVKDIYNGLSRALNMDTNTPENVAALAKQIFDPRNKEALYKIAAENRIGTFETLVTPKVIDSLLKSGDQAAIQFGIQWANDQFDVIAKPAQDTIYDRAANSQGLKFKFEGNRFTFDAIPGQPQSALEGAAKGTLAGKLIGGIAEGWDAKQNAAAVRAVGDINRYISVMEPIWKAQGSDIQTAIALKMADINAVSKNPTLLKMLGDAVLNSISGPADGKQSSASFLTSSAQAAIPASDEPLMEGNSPVKATPDVKGRGLGDYSRAIPKEDVQDADQFLMSVLNKGQPKSYVTDLNDDFAGRLAGLIKSAPPEIKQHLGVLSGARSVKRQAELWDAALKRYGSVAEARKWVAPPGKSRHNTGKAADLAWKGDYLRNAPAWVVKWVHDNAAAQGLEFPLANENWHVELAGDRRKKG